MKHVVDYGLSLNKDLVLETRYFQIVFALRNNLLRINGQVPTKKRLFIVNEGRVSRAIGARKLLLISSYRFS
jgi:hypothetical protein